MVKRTPGCNSPAPYNPGGTLIAKKEAPGAFISRCLRGGKMRTSPTTSKVTKFSGYVNREQFTATYMDSYVTKLESQMGFPAYGMNYVTLKSGLVRITLIFKEEERA
jgi:hypothetical protein